MEKEFVPYAEALELKKLGFDEPCFGEYRQWDSESWLEIYQDAEMEFTDTRYTVECKAPTYSKAFRWFRDKYPDFDFGVAKIHNGTNNYHYHINLKWEFFEGTYEEAELACLIKLIEIVKTK
jgi:hypothetical protein